MKYRIIVSELDTDNNNPRPVYEQVVEGIDLRGLIVAINSAPRKRIRNRIKHEAASSAE